MWQNTSVTFSHTCEVTCLLLAKQEVGFVAGVQLCPPMRRASGLQADVAWVHSAMPVQVVQLELGAPHLPITRQGDCPRLITITVENTLVAHLPQRQLVVSGNEGEHQHMHSVFDVTLHEHGT